MEEKVLSKVEMTENGLFKIEFSGKRCASQMVESWLEIKNAANGFCKSLLVVDNMKGEINPEGVCLLTELLSEYYFYKEKKIAILLNNKDSYSPRFFDLFAKSWGLNTKHFTCETEALEWLGKEDVHELNKALPRSGQS
jgi:hypothetical protein